jgi:hypothetical protein
MAISAIALVERIVSLLFSKGTPYSWGTGLFSLVASFGRAKLLILVRMCRVIPAIKVTVLNSLSRYVETWKLVVEVVMSYILRTAAYGIA